MNADTLKTLGRISAELTETEERLEELYEDLGEVFENEDEDALKAVIDQLDKAMGLIDSCADQLDDLL